MLDHEAIAGFRNILVHDYLKLNRSLVYENLQKELANLNDFSLEVAKLMSKGKT